MRVDEIGPFAKRTDEEYIGHDMSWRRTLGVHSLRECSSQQRCVARSGCLTCCCRDKLLVRTAGQLLECHARVATRFFFIFPRNRPVPACKKSGVEHPHQLRSGSIGWVACQYEAISTTASELGSSGEHMIFARTSGTAASVASMLHLMANQEVSE